VKFSVEIDSENEAMSQFQILLILKKISGAISQGIDASDGKTILDVNGNSVGTWELIP
jgi:hypothetical protein